MTSLPATAVMTRRCELLEAANLLSGCVLDLCSGRGELLAQVGGRVAAACGYEPDERLAAEANRLCLTTFTSIAEIPDAPFSLVTAFGALERVPRPADLVALAARSLAPGGAFVAEVRRDMTAGPEGAGSRLTPALLESLADEQGLTPHVEPIALEPDLSVLWLIARRPRR